MRRPSTPTRRVTDRDTRLLVTLYRYRCLTTGQVRVLLFPSDQTAVRRIRHLDTAGYLRVIDLPGVDQRAVVLARRGAELVARHLGVPPDAVTYPTLGREAQHPFFVRHHIEVTDFRIALERECGAVSVLNLLGFLPEFLVKRVDSGRMERYLRDVIATGDGDPIAHTPDGVFAIERFGRAALFFVEVDRATETIGRSDKGVLKAMRFYLGYLRGGTFQRYRKDFGVDAAFNGFRLLFVTTSVKRIENIRRASDAIDDIGDRARRFIWLTHKDEVRSHGILHATWVSLDPADPSQYMIDGDTRGHE